MNKEDLLPSVKRINPVSKGAADEYQEKSGEIISLMNIRMLERKDIVKLVGQNNLDMMKDNHANHMRFMNSIFQHFNPETYLETILWVFRAYRSHGFQSNYWAALMNTFIETLGETLSEKTYLEIFPYYEWMQVNIPAFVKISDSTIQKNN